MNDNQRQVQGLRPDREVMTQQRLPYFIGISGQTVNATTLSMHLVVIPPGGARSRTCTWVTKPESTCSREPSSLAGDPRWNTKS